MKIISTFMNRDASVIESRQLILAAITITAFLASFFGLRQADVAMADHYDYSTVYGSGSTSFSHCAVTFTVGINYCFSHYTAGFNAGGGEFVFEGFNDSNGWKETANVCWFRLTAVDSLHPSHNRVYLDFQGSSILSSHGKWPHHGSIHWQGGYYPYTEWSLKDGYDDCASTGGTWVMALWWLDY